MKNKRLIGAVLSFCLYTSLALGAEPGLDTAFDDPPASAKPRVYWWWLDSNLSKAGITRDLEEMKRKGIAGAMIFDAHSGARYSHTVARTPAGPSFLSPQWQELFRHTIAEADRLGIEISMNLGSGWNCGGPWVTPEYSAQKIAWSEVAVNGPTSFSATLPISSEVQANLPGYPPFYRDIAVVAVPEPASAATPGYRVTASSQSSGVAANAFDGDFSSAWISGEVAPQQEISQRKPEWIQIDYDKPHRASALLVMLVPFAAGPCHGELQCRQADGQMRKLVEFEALKPATFVGPDGDQQIVTFPEVESRCFRLLMTPTDPLKSHPVIHDINLGIKAALRVCVAELLLAPREEMARDIKRLPNWPIKGLYTLHADVPCDVPTDTAAELASEPSVDPSSVIDLTKRLTADGKLDWQVPPGRWSILRIGHTPTGIRVTMHTEGVGGPMLDHLSREAMDLQFRHVAGTVLKALGDQPPKSFYGLCCDSWEVGAVNWTPRFREEFQQRRGYDLLPYLPALVGKTIGSRQQTDRFFYDFRKTVGDLAAENHYGRFRELAHRHHLQLHSQSAGGGGIVPVDVLRSAAQVDIPMGEFWASGNVESGDTDADRYFVRMAATASHVYGRKLVSAESLTSLGPHWEEDPATLKPVADHGLCEGANRIFFHTFTHSPPEVGKPGNEYYAGTHFNPQITWWEQAGAWTRYIARCQLLLQQGLFVADVCRYYGDQVPNRVPPKRIEPDLGPGYDSDVAGAEVVLSRMSVDHGRIVLPDGMSYALLVLPNRETIDLAVLRKIADLVKAGATVVGPKPSRATGLQDYPRCDREVAELADAVWGPCDGRTVQEHRFGEGRVIWGKTPRQIFAAEGLTPDFEATTEVGNRRSPIALDWIHRRNGETDIYFVANPQDKPIQTECLFRVKGKQPEIWDAVSGDRHGATGFRAEGGRTAAALEFAPCQSCFVVFRRPASSPTESREGFPQLKRVAELAGPWIVRFDPAWGGPEQVVFERLQDWTQRPESGIKFYSGKATYETTFDLPESLAGAKRPIYLDLGKVKNVADVRLNGKELGVVWTSPWRVDIARAVQPTGNKLQIDVVNLWPNRLIGDASLPADKRVTSTNVRKFTPDSPLLESGLLGPVGLHVQEMGPRD